MQCVYTIGMNAITPAVITTILCLSLLAGTNVFAQGSPAKARQAGARVIDVKKAFPFYDTYLRIPADARDGFRLGYRLSGAPGSARPQMNYLLAHTRTPIDIGPTGIVQNLPDSNMLNNGKIEVGAGQPRISISLDLQPIVPLARTISVEDAANPLNDYAGAIRRAGPLAALAPKLNGVVFKGVASGEAVFGDGRRVALGSANGGIIFKPAQPNMRGAVSLAFPTSPREVSFAQ